LIDGLWDHHIEELLRHPPESPHPPAQRLVEDAVHRSGKDNTTAVVVEIVAPSVPTGAPAAS
jgi:protein phosphatase